jgi:hypothetical protein
MAVATAIIGYGTLFSFGNGATPEVFTALAEVVDVTPPSDTVDIIETTHMTSPNRTKEFIAGLNDPGECSFDIHFIPGAGDDAVIQTRRNLGTKNNYRITWSNGVTWTFAGILTGYTPSAPVNDRMTATVTFKVTSSYVAAAAAAPENLVLPAISGVAQVGETLYAWPGTWTQAGTFTFQWEADGSPISGATGQTYVPVVGQITDVITVEVTCTNAAGSDSATSIATAAVIAA